ncbi:MAG: lipoprotein-releasing system permease protein [Chitinophagales bacterium]|jgi:lipoprotein-releasing system permease protein
MNFPLFIVKKIAFNQHQAFSRFILKISIAAVALSMAVMIIATALISGFQQTISQKVYGFWAHVIITPFAAAESLDKVPVSKESDIYRYPSNYEGVNHIQSVALKAGIIHTKDDFEGIILKGIGADFKTTPFVNYIKEGQLFPLDEDKNNKGILISSISAKRLQVGLGDKLLISFFEDDAKVRKRSFAVSGIYNSGLEEFDKQYAWIDIAVIQNLNGWEEDEVGGFELFVDDDHLYEAKLKVYAKKLAAIFLHEEEAFEMQKEPLDKLGEDIFYSIDNDLYAQTIKEFKPDIFNWLSLQNTNEIVILVVMLLVAAVNMITSLLILILERTQMIGTLKALGSSNKQLRNIFIWNGVFIIGFGLIIGNLAGIGLCMLQDATHIIKLPEDSYYINYAPVKLEWSWLLFLNLFTLITGALFLLLPAMLVNKIEAIRAIRFS